jgi:hypothetical protein
VALVELVSENVVTLPAELTLEEVYGRLGSKVLHVEPLSRKVPLADFILSGGLGWGSLKNGSFASKLFKVQTDKFTFGSNFSTSVNAGYPLHRLMEGMPHELCPYPDSKIERVTVPVRPAPQVKALFKACAVGEAARPVAAANFAWVNTAAASAMGVSGAGSLAFFEEFEPEGEGEPVQGAYEKRFFEDAIPSGYKVAKVLTVKSNLPKLEEIAKKSGRFFVCVWVHLGVLACISCEAGAVAEIEREAAKLPLTFTLPRDGKRLSGPVTPRETPEAPAKPEPARPAPPKEEKKETPKPAAPPPPKPEPEKPKAEAAAAKPQSPAQPAKTEEKPPVAPETKPAEPEKPKPGGETGGQQGPAAAGPAKSAPKEG